MNFDWIIVGAGFSGAVMAERIAEKRGERVLIIDRRDHIAGNAYDFTSQSGVTISKYGPHIFHTNSEKVWDYCSRFTEWNFYQHRVLGHIDGQLVPIPINFNSIQKLFPDFLSRKIEESLLSHYKYGDRVSILKLLESKNPDLEFIGDYIFQRVFLNYTKKQWGMEPNELSPQVLSRVPVSMNRDDRYFNDRFQGIPIPGYSAMFSKMLSHPKIVVSLGIDYKEIKGQVGDAKVIYTGPIDEYYDYEFGHLPYRSLDFKFVHRDVENYLSVGTVNYPNEFDFTRVTEQKYFTDEKTSSTTLIYEYPRAYEQGVNDPYYPIPNEAHNALHAKYVALAKRPGEPLFLGRLADYRYYNMDQAVARALTIFDKL